MSLASILQRVQNKGKLPVKAGDENPKKDPQKPSSSAPSPPKARQVDPVVAQLKEKRRLENELKLQLAREKKGLPPLKRQTAKLSTAKTPSKPRAQTSQTAKLSGGTSKSNGHNATRNAHRPTSSAQPATSAARAGSGPAKKLKFTELMKRASKIDQSQLSINIRPKTASPEVSLKSKPTVKSSNSKRPERPSKMAPVRAPSGPANKSTQQTKAKTPIPIRKPSSVLEQKLKSKSGPNRQSSSRYERYGDDGDEYDDDEELDGFVVSDEEDHNQYQEADYDRDEIWAMFNKGKKRSYYDKYDDYDSDDMEATGAEILDEEFRSRRTAELEDRKEALEEQRLAAAKRARKNRR
jgi:protein SPT2